MGPMKLLGLLDFDDAHTCARVALVTDRVVLRGR